MMIVGSSAQVPSQGRATEGAQAQGAVGISRWCSSERAALLCFNSIAWLIFSFIICHCIAVLLRAHLSLLWVENHQHTQPYICVAVSLGYSYCEDTMRNRCML